jgi:glucan endo-1,3-beta-D-glucosidase
VPIDNANPDRVIGNSFSADISLTKSTLFDFHLPPTYAGKSCNLTFILPRQSADFWTPFEISSPGGLNFIQLNNLASTTTSRCNVSDGVGVGRIDQLRPGQRYTVSTAACQAGQGIGYELESIGGLDLRFFQLQIPPLGLFITASG